MDQAEHGEDPEHLQQLAPIDHVFALGDCCARMDLALPALAQVRRLPFSLLGAGTRPHQVLRSVMIQGEGALNLSLHARACCVVRCIGAAGMDEVVSAPQG